MEINRELAAKVLSVVDSEQLRSGTWATVRYARAAGKRYIIIFPDGTHKVYPAKKVEGGN